MIDNRLRFPIGKFKKPEFITSEIVADWIKIIKHFPNEISSEVINLSEYQLLYKYRAGSWNIKQLVHHCADSHLNSFIRFKLSLTEETPIIKPYFEDKWAELDDYKNASIIHSLKIIEGLHARWSILLESLTEQQLVRDFYHPADNKKINLSENIGIYAWHCNHHIEHIRLAKTSKIKYK